MEASKLLWILLIAFASLCRANVPAAPVDDGLDLLVGSGEFAALGVNTVSEECPGIKDESRLVWQKVSTHLLTSQMLVYRNSALLGLQGYLAGLEVVSRTPNVQHLYQCPHLAAYWFAQAGDLAASLEQPKRARVLFQIGNMFKLQALSRWWNCFHNNGTVHERPEHSCLGINRRWDGPVWYPLIQGRYQLALLGFKERLETMPLELNLASTYKPKIEIHTLCDFPPGSRMPGMAFINHQAYAKAHGYDYSFHSKKVLKDQEAHFTKAVIAFRRLNEGQAVGEYPASPPPDWLMWMDCDAFFTNFTIPIEVLLNTYTTPDTKLVIAEDPGGINTGVMFLKKDKWTLDFLQAVVDNPFRIAWDQSMIFMEAFSRRALDPMLESDVDGDFAMPSEVVLVHQSVMNAFVPPASKDWFAYEWREGDFIKHFAGCPSLEDVCLYGMEATLEYAMPQVGLDWAQLSRQLDEQLAVEAQGQGGMIYQ